MLKGLGTLWDPRACAMEPWMACILRSPCWAELSVSYQSELARTLYCWLAGTHGTSWETEVWKAETDMIPFKGLLFCQG